MLTAYADYGEGPSNFRFFAMWKGRSDEDAEILVVVALALGDNSLA